MITTNVRSYNCKDEELPVIGNKVLFSFKRDQADFSGYSPKFNSNYATELEGKIQTVFDLTVPKSETVQLKVITDGVYTAMDGFDKQSYRIHHIGEIGQNDFCSRFWINTFTQMH